jgi:Tol biopolymer transport system component
MRDDRGIVQIWTISPNGGEPAQLTSDSFDVDSAISWSLDGKLIAYIADNSVFTIDTASRETTWRTERTDDATAPRSEACVFSPNGNRIAYVRRVVTEGVPFNQIFVATLQ